MIRCRYIHAEKEWKSIVIDQWKSLMAPPSVNSQRRFASKLHTHTACRNPSRHRIRSPFTLPPHAAPFIDYTLITSHSQHFEFIAAVNQSALFVRLAPLKSKSDWITLLCLSVLHRKSYSFHQPAVLQSAAAVRHSSLLAEQQSFSLSFFSTLRQTKMFFS